MKNVLRILAALTLASCTTVPVVNEPVVTPTSTPAAVSPSDSGKIVLGKITALDSEIPMIKQAAVNANKIIASSCFKKHVMAGSFTESNNLSNKQIYDLVTTTTVKVDVEMYMGSWYVNHVYKTVGYENEPGKVYMNRYFVGNSVMAGSNLLHECAHSLGFSHYNVKATSIPYKFNDFYDECSDEVGVK